MEQTFMSENWKDFDGNPAGGIASGAGFCISWQNGPLGQGEERKEPNGAFVETIIVAAKQRIEHYQEGRFNCKENAEALHHLEEALKWLRSRTASREARGVEGINKE